MKIILKTFLITASLASFALADFTRVEMGAGMWSQTPNGDISYTANGGTGKNSIDKTASQEVYAWLLIEHPIPIVPNIRIEYAGVQSSGRATGTFKNFTATGGTTSLDMKEYDIIPYYSILDNTFWLTLNAGLDIKIIQLDYKANDVTIVGSINSVYSDTTTVAIPLLYLRVRTEIPITNIGLEADVKYISYSSNTIYDARVKADYTLDFFPLIQPSFELGYRVQKIQTDASQDANINLDFSGIYAGLLLRF